MKVIFTQNVKPHKKDDVAEVKDGYAQNYLFKNKLAIPATQKNLDELQRKFAEKDIQDNLREKEAAELCKKINGIVVRYELKKSQSGKAIGSVSNKDIAKTLGLITDKEFSTKDIKVDKITTFGITEVKVKLYKSEAIINIEVVEGSK